MYGTTEVVLFQNTTCPKEYATLQVAFLKETP
jgi:hypothetical protein